MTRLSKFLCVAATAATLGTAASAQDVTLILHHFLPPVSNAHKDMLEPWAEKIETESGGRIAVEIAPSMSMGGKPNELYGQVRDGTADIIWTILGYTPGVFPRSEVFELPLVHAGSAADTTVALNASLDMLADDFKDVKVLFLHSHDGNLIHTSTKAVRSFDDAAGLKLRTPGRTGAWVITGMGAEPVGMPVPALPEAMAKGVVDGALTTYEIVPAINLQELDKFATELPNGDRFGTSVFMLAMNKDIYEDMPEDLRAIIDANSGMNVAKEIGALWEGFEEPGIAALEGAGVERIVLSDEEGAKFNAVSEGVVQRWVDEVSAKGIDGAALVEGARKAIADAHASN
ncbi:TRAP transporter substrate-binding protein [Pseudooceanicola nanhaiensis]|uniref:TRAP transporter substrate-binding protein n=1 Tax=Pseudooceanicola nanhaiensis TaxID=375761 RepID=UPI001CD1B2EA|nr:TRAP transporter substrate-binding protein [Pseudooceanicola nanhaiensis]MCA0918795.1 TRAP transporter substrate-binding protein [Pseudooceanicola nanhaiensis]